MVCAAVDNVAATNFYDMLMCGIMDVFSGSEILFAIGTLIIFACIAYYFRLNSTISLGIGIVLTWAIGGLFEFQNEQLRILMVLLIIGFAIKLAFGFKNALER